MEVSTASFHEKFKKQTVGIFRVASYYSDHTVFTHV